MEKIEIEIENKEDFAVAINNAIVALNEIRRKFFFGGIDLSREWLKWCDKNYNGDTSKCEEILIKRLELLNNIYYQIENNKN